MFQRRDISEELCGADTQQMTLGFDIEMVCRAPPTGDVHTPAHSRTHGGRAEELRLMRHDLIKESL